MDADKISNSIQWESFMSRLDPLLDEGLHVTITKTRHIDSGDTYLVEITDDDGTILATGENWPLTEAMSDAYQSTPEGDKT